MAKNKRLLVGHEHGLSGLESSDGGKTWSEPSVLVPDVEVTTIVQVDEEIYVGTRGAGILHGTTAPGSNWQRLDAPPALDKVRSLTAVDGSLLAGTEPPGVFEWQGGTTWRRLGDVTTTPGADTWSYPVPDVDVHVRDVAADTANRERLYAAIQVGGIALSPDHGRTWQERSQVNLDVHMIRTDPQRPGWVVAGAGFDPRSAHTDGMYRSDDSGETWRSISAGWGNFVVQFAVDPRDSDTLIVGTSRGYPPEWGKNGTARGEIIRTRDGGTSWEKLRGGLPDEMESHITAVALDAAEPEHVFFAGGLQFGPHPAADQGVYHSADGGDTWQRVCTIANAAALHCHARSV